MRCGAGWKVANRYLIINRRPGAYTNNAAPLWDTVNEMVRYSQK
jgi:hypothetical protein